MDHINPLDGKILISVPEFKEINSISIGNGYFFRTIEGTQEEAATLLSTTFRLSRKLSFKGAFFRKEPS